MMAGGYLILRRGNPSARLASIYILILLVWTIYILSVVLSGALRNLQIPFIPLLLFLPAIAIILYATSGHTMKSAIGHIPVYVPVYVQSFRILVELMIYGTFLEGVLPEQVTFEGANFDIAVGMSALVVGLLAQKGKIGPRGILAWNVASLFVLATTLLAFASFFYFRGELPEPVNMRFVELPYVLLPAFLVPFALFYHVVSIRQCLLQLATSRA